jgi:hypothetical protein
MAEPGDVTTMRAPFREHCCADFAKAALSGAISLITADISLQATKISLAKRETGKIDTSISGRLSSKA